MCWVKDFLLGRKSKFDKNKRDRLKPKFKATDLCRFIVTKKTFRLPKVNLLKASGIK